MRVEQVADKIHHCKIAIMRCDESVELVKKEMIHCIQRAAIIRGIADAKREWEVEDEKWKNHESWKRRLDNLR